MRKLTKKAFREWLEGFRPRQVVGYSVSAVRCPIARYIDGEVTRHVLLVKGRNYASPVWVSAFTRHVDNAGLYRITASRALKILEEC